MMMMMMMMRPPTCVVLGFVVLIVSFVSVQGRLEAAAIVPHGDFVLKPSLLPLDTKERIAAEQISMAAREVSHWWNTGSHKPLDLILLSTPHGIALSSDLALYLGSHASGSAPLGQDLNNNDTVANNTVSVEVVHLEPILLEPNLSRQIIVQASAVSSSLKVQGVSVPTDLMDDAAGMPLHWGEVIPLLVMKPDDDDGNNNDNTNTSGSTNRRRHIILSHPLRRYEEAGTATMVRELLELGGFLRNWMDAQEDVAIGVLISSDLSHTHRADGPYGYSNSSASFDRIVGYWAADPCRRASSLLEEARVLQPAAMACGYTGLVLLHGILCHNSNNNDDGQEVVVEDEWQAQVLANLNATYYGMMVANYSRTMTVASATATKTIT